MSSPEEIKVRPASLDEIDAIVLLDRSIEKLPHWTAEQYRNALPEPGTYPLRCLYIADHAGKTVGLAVGRVDDIVGERAGELESVAVAESVQRRGLGLALCRAIIAWTRSHHAAHLDLEVRSRSEGAVALYRQLGFVEVGERHRYYRDPPDDALLMRLRLKGETLEAGPSREAGS